jgi:hypothetical protein
MTDGPRILRTVGVPLVIAVILLVVLPRMCARAIDAARLQAGGGATSTSTTATTDSGGGGLHISTTSPDAPASASPLRPLHYPAGLDAERIQYLVEIDPSFSQAATMRVPKGDTTLWTDAETRFPILPAVIRHGYFEKSGGSYAPTREAALHLDGMTEDSAGWLVPVGKRKFGSISRLEDQGDGTWHATIRWRWEPNALGAEILPKAASHESAADFRGGERHWALIQINALDQAFD